MTLISDMTRLETRAAAAGVSIARILRSAEVSSSTWIRGKRGKTRMTDDTWTRISDAAEKLMGKRK